MATKRVSTGKKTTRRKTAAATPELTDGAVMEVLESAQSAMAASMSIDPDVAASAGGGGGILPG